VIDAQPENHLLCKYKLLNAQATGYMDGMTGMRENYLNALKAITTECPGTEEAIYAAELVKKLEAEQTKPNEQEQPKDTEEEKPEEQAPVDQSLFTYDEAARYYFMIVVPLGKGDMNAMKASISDFNADLFKTLALKVSSNMLDKDHQVLLVKTFNKMDDAINYFKVIQGNDAFKSILDQGFAFSLISKENYVTLFKNKQIDAYQTFFNASYSTK
jgi:hypothetical protein